jgi:hypothetical protein
VSVDQQWSVLNINRIRVEFTVQRVERDENGELRAYGVLVSGRNASFTVAALAKGSRGARLVRHADGHEPYRPKETCAPTTETTKTASDYRRTSAPKGIGVASPHMEEAFRMRYELGMSLDDVAAHFDVPKNRIAGWCAQVRHKREDERNLKGGRV